MNTGHRSVRRLANGNIPYSRDTICTSCLHRIARQPRRHAATAAAVASDPPQQQDPQNPPATNTGPRKAYRVLASPVVSRPPLLTRDLTSFEKAFYLYQKRLNERLALPFTRYFYYKKGTPADVEWKRKVKVRKSASRDIGVYTGYGEHAWHDEVLVGDKTAEPESQVDALIKDAEGMDTVEGKPVGDIETGGEAVGGNEKDGEGVRKSVGMDTPIQRPAPRVTEADKKNDLRSLSRKMDRSLYLLVKNKDGQWRFPQDRVYGRENLHQAAERTLLQACGINMNTWVVGNHPVGHYFSRFAKAALAKIPPNRLVSTSTEHIEREEHGERVFFMKVRIMAGQADLEKNEFGDTEFRWLAKEEIKDVVEESYWGYIRGMLTER